MKQLFIFLLLFQAVSAIAVRKNPFRGHGVVYHQLIQEDGGFEQLRNYGYKQVFYPSGSIYLEGEFVRKRTITWDTSEKKWLSRFYYDHALEFKLGREIQDKITKNSYESKKTAEILVKELKFYQGKFQNVVLNLSEYCHDQFNISFIKKSLKQYNKKIGLKLNLKAIKEDKEVFVMSPDFFIFEVDLNDQRDLDYYLKKLSKLNVPYSLSFTMKAKYFMEGNEIHLEKDELESFTLISEEKQNSGMKRLYKVSSDSSTKFRMNQRVVELSPSVMVLNQALRKSEKIGSFWYNGHVIDLNTWSSRLLTRNDIKYLPPRIEYLKTKTHRGLELALNLKNPNPVGTSQYKDQAGIALKLRGYQLKSIDMSAFDNIKAFSANGNKYLYFTLNQLNAFAKSGTIKLQLDENGENPNISSVAWLKLPAEVDYLYDNGDFSTRIPEYQLKHFSAEMD